MQRNGVKYRLIRERKKKGSAPVASVYAITIEGTTEQVRISVAVVAESNLNPYLEHVQTSEIPKYEAAEGLVSFCVLKRPFVAYGELLIISFWQSEQALTRFLETQTPTPAATESYSRDPPGSPQLHISDFW